MKFIFCFKGLLGDRNIRMNNILNNIIYEKENIKKLKMCDINLQYKNGNLIEHKKEWINLFIVWSAYGWILYFVWKEIQPHYKEKANVLKSQPIGTVFYCF